MRVRFYSSFRHRLSNRFFPGCLQESALNVGFAFICLMVFWGSTNTLFAEDEIKASAPLWKLEDLSAIHSASSQIGSSEFSSPEAKDQTLVKLVARAYGFGVQENTAEIMAIDLLRRIEQKFGIRKDLKLSSGKIPPLHQLILRLYKDAADRTRGLRVLERGGSLSDPLRSLEVDFVHAAQMIQGSSVKGILQPLPLFDLKVLGQRSYIHKAQKLGAYVLVRNNTILVDDMERQRFDSNHQLPPDIKRSANGSIYEVFAALRLVYQRDAIVGMVEHHKKNIKIMTAAIPGELPSLYLNEIARAASDAGYKTLALLVQNASGGELFEIQFELEAKKKSKFYKSVTCKDEWSVQKCIDFAVSSMSKRLFLNVF